MELYLNNIVVSLERCVLILEAIVNNDWTFFTFSFCTILQTFFIVHVQFQFHFFLPLWIDIKIFKVFEINFVQIHA